MKTYDLKTTAQERAQVAQAVAVIQATLANGGRKDVCARFPDVRAADPICVLLVNLNRTLQEVFGDDS